MWDSSTGLSSALVKERREGPFCSGKKPKFPGKIRVAEEEQESWNWAQHKDTALEMYKLK
jgi:hypothetical protein